MSDDKKTIDIDTGLPGFTIDENRYILKTTNVESEENEVIEIPAEKKVVIDIPENKDLTKPMKRTLASYIGKKTEGNYIPLDGSDYIETDIKDGVRSYDDFKTASPTKKVYASREELHNVTIPKSIHTNVQIDTKVEYDKAITAANADLLTDPKNKKYNGNTLLKSDTAINQVETQYTSNILKYNRFTPSYNKANQQYEGLKEFRGEPEAFRHPRFGDISLKRAQQIGPALSIRASQELNATNDENDPTSGGTEARALLPGFNQLGITKVDTLVLEAKDVLEDLTKADFKGNEIDVMSKSWGSLNNVHDQYSNMTALGMVALSIALTAATIAAFEGLSFIFGSLSSSATVEKKNSAGRFILGSSYNRQVANPNALIPMPFDIGSLLGIRPTIAPFKKCLSKGVKIFFGVDSDGGILGTIGAIATNSSSPQSAGFNVVSARAIIRSVQSFNDYFKSLFSSPNLVSGIKNILAVVDVIRQSKLIAALNVFATLGDQALSQKKIHNITDGLAQGEVKVSETDSIRENEVGASSRKNRINNSELKLAWANNRTPSMLLMPGKILNLANKGKLGAPVFSGILEKNSKNYVLNAEKRLSAEQVEEIEKRLEAEYCPFYFHDLRTNEIVSFHAFLESLNDDYTASWDPVSGFGRVEDIKIYKNTTRKIGMSFRIVATSKTDFDEMWLKINKLTTLVYPQYTQGKLIESQDKSYKFVQPFSQLQGASPLIRIRLGDLFTSNYSRFALARLFGIGTEDVTLDRQTITPNTETGTGENASIAGRIRQKNSSDRWEILATILQSPSKSGIKINVSIPFASSNSSQASTLDMQSFEACCLAFKVIDVDDNNVIVEPTVPTPSDLANSGLSPKAIIDIIQSIERRFNNKEDNPSEYVIGGKYVTHISTLYPWQPTLKKMSEQPATDGIEAITKFLSKENAIIKSFESVKGRGLAGIIESMNFDWNGVLWEQDFRKKAPTMCKVTISFSPIHDISPGIDYLGYNRSPIYGVGYSAPQREDLKSKS